MGRESYEKWSSLGELKAGRSWKKLAETHSRDYARRFGLGRGGWGGSLKLERGWITTSQCSKGN